MAAMRSLGLGMLVAAAAFALGTQLATRVPGGSPGERARAALSEPDPIARAMALVPVLQDARSPEFAEIEAAYRATLAGGGPGDLAIALLGEAWAPLDPAGALDRLSAWPLPARLTARKALLRAWARRNPEAAMEWAAGIRDDGTAAEAVFTGWAESGDPKIWDHLATLEPSLEREAAAVAMMQWWIAREGFDGLFARVEALPDAPLEFKEAAMGTATRLVANHDPARALAFADRHAASAYGRGLLRRVAVMWVLRDGPTAMQNMLDRPASPDRDWALRRAYITWLREDRAAALAWVPESAHRDARFTPLLDVYARAIAKNDPEHRGDAIRRAVGWAERIADAEKRHQTLVMLGVMWLHYEPETASAWLVQNGLDAEVRAEAVKLDLKGSP